MSHFSIHQTCRAIDEPGPAPSCSCTTVIQAVIQGFSYGLKDFGLFVFGNLISWMKAVKMRHMPVLARAHRILYPILGFFPLFPKQIRGEKFLKLVTDFCSQFTFDFKILLASSKLVKNLIDHLLIHGTSPAKGNLLAFFVDVPILRGGRRNRD